MTFIEGLGSGTIIVDYEITSSTKVLIIYFTGGIRKVFNGKDAIDIRERLNPILERLDLTMS
jgi:hypothetical protein